MDLFFPALRTEVGGCTGLLSVCTLEAPVPKIEAPLKIATLSPVRKV